ncbi:helix-turn-helix domain-containing protein [Flavobacterium algicola]|uniref:helix-turn-helix domain-containing protein n=1 Tax=Flavobacterium algicola TaxID=556529 RepID=UPI001EFE551D|nr:AraC family transcriptional regulator [Flavobacterium algicola]MCG9792860.1 AraC family transcriptional regulator [Flavobacterium algicola]
MKTIMKSEIFENETIIINDPIQFNNEQIVDKKIDVNQKGVVGTINDIMLNGIHLIMRDLTIKNDYYTIEVEHSFSFVKLHFEIEGNNEYCPKNKDEIGIYIPQGHYNLFYLPVINGHLHYNTSKRKTLEITFTESYLQQLFYPNLNKTIPLLAEAISQHKAYKMWQKSKTICPKLHFLIEDILQCTYSGAIKKAFLESKVVEILAYLFTVINEEENSIISEELSQCDYLKILEVEAILKTRFKEKHSLASIASEVGLNDYKVKKNFKIVFNKTVFNYLAAIRMDYAKQLIADEGFSIAQVAEELDYKNPQHFTVAFKKIMGYLPSKLKK